MDDVDNRARGGMESGKSKELIEELYFRFFVMRWKRSRKP